MIKVGVEVHISKRFTGEMNFFLNFLTNWRMIYNNRYIKVVVIYNTLPEWNINELRGYILTKENSSD